MGKQLLRHRCKVGPTCNTEIAARLGPALSFLLRRGLETAWINLIII